MHYIMYIRWKEIPAAQGRSEAEFLDEIPTKVLRFKSFLLAIHSHLNSFALRVLFLQTHATSYIFLQLSYCTL
jgi:hypothetical protein